MKKNKIPPNFLSLPRLEGTLGICKREKLPIKTQQSSLGECLVLPLKKTELAKKLNSFKKSRQETSPVYKFKPHENYQNLKKKYSIKLKINQQRQKGKKAQSFCVKQLHQLTIQLKFSKYNDCLKKPEKTSPKSKNAEKEKKVNKKRDDEIKQLFIRKKSKSIKENKKKRYTISQSCHDKNLIVCQENSIHRSDLAPWQNKITEDFFKIPHFLEE